VDNARDARLSQDRLRGACGRGARHHGRCRAIEAERIADAQDIPIKFLETILLELKHAGVVRSQRGPDGGYTLARPAADISIADVIRAVDGPLANVRGDRPENISYRGAAVRLTDVWIAVRAALREILESTSLADLRDGSLPPRILELAGDPEAWVSLGRIRGAPGATTPRVS
jgi:Rrf2 family protein